MAKRFYMLAQGDLVGFHELPDLVEEGDGADVRLVPATLPKGAVEVPRFPVDGETWDPAAKAFVLDDEVAARIQSSIAETDLAHTLKHAEAILVASGVALKAGLLYEEAQATGAKIADLAAAVLVNARPFMDREIARRKRIETARALKGKTK